MRTINARKRKPAQQQFHHRVAVTVLLLLVTGVDSGCKQNLLQQPVPANACEAICQRPKSGSNATTCELRFLVILPSQADKIEAVHQRVQPVLELASKAIHHYKILPDYVKIVFDPHDDNCDQALANIAVMDSFDNENEQCPHAILGPSCDYPTG